MPPVARLATALTIGACLVVVDLAALQVGPTLITTATNVHLRARPSTTTPVVATLALGTELTERPAFQVAPGWGHVATGSGQSGWLQDRFVTTFDTTRRGQIVAEIVAERLPAEVRPTGLTPGTFASRRQAVELLERTIVLEGDTGTQARLSWLYLRALKHAVDAIPSDRARDAGDRAWLDARVAVVAESIAQWVVRPALVRATHTRFASSAAADDIGWFLVEQGLGGECEGDIPCYVTHANGTFGEYLRWHPTGARAAQAVKGVGDSLDGIMNHLERFPRVLAAFTRDDCGALAAVLTPLRAAVDGAAVADKAAALAALSRFSRLCE